MQANGNFVCYGGDGHAYWATGTQGHQNADVVLQDDGNLILYQNGKSLWATNTVQDWNLNDSFTFDTGDAHLDTGEWMHTWASMASGGLISGRTRIWCTIDLRGFHGSVIPMLLDAAGKVIWPPNPQVSKQGPWGVDGVWIGPHDRTIPWAVTSDPAVLGQAKSLTCFQYRDPKNMLLTDLHILGDVVGTVADLIKKVAG
jgi:hypothetical protein